MENVISSIIRIDFLEFVAAKSNLNLVFAQLFIESYWLRIRIFIVNIL